ncbi:hypothetical protein [Bacteroides sp.]|uniref:hypothetical protein n=1 Tax=Bacteroides sp. TaxID=29523 RepID=UPI0025BC975F|nr:hypothetical protein [Bacteroides sp.]
MKTKIIAVLLLLNSSMMFAQIDQKNDSVSDITTRSSMTNALTSSDDRMFHRLGLGDIDDPTAMFSAFQREPLQKTKGDYITLYSFITNCFYNVAYNRLFLVRDAAGDEWTTARFHEGISIDDSFSKPGETRTWWERDPYDRIQSWGDGAETYMTINRGNVGIGTLDPQGYKLAVNGTIRAKEIKVDSDWADFVFKKGYKLPTLEEVEQHIGEKGTLPGVPSEEEVKVNGVNLAETNALLLQKIEELTLYIIEMKKEINELKKR